MPLYDFENIETGEVETKMMSISSMEEYVKDPNIRQVLAAPKIVGGTKSTTRPGQHPRTNLRRLPAARHERRIPVAHQLTFY